MCNLYRMQSNVAAIAKLFGVADATANLPGFDAVYPDRDAPVVRSRADQRQIDVLRWGWPRPDGAKGWVTNVRNLASPYWRHALATPAQRCLVPVTAFSEWSAAPNALTGKKSLHWFDLPDAPLFAFAGLWQRFGDTQRFAFLTCTPNALVGAVHPKAMPVILTPAQHAVWLSGDAAAVTALARPYDSAAMREMA